MIDWEETKRAYVKHYFVVYSNLIISIGSWCPVPHLHHSEVIIDLFEEGRGQIEWEKLHRQKTGINQFAFKVVGRVTYTAAGHVYYTCTCLMPNCGLEEAHCTGVWGCGLAQNSLQIR